MSNAKSKMLENVLNCIKSALYAVFVYLGIKTGTVEVLFWLMLADSFLGIIKALRLGYQFSFKRLAWGMVTKLSLLLIPMVVALVGKGLSMEFNFFVVTIINILIVSEGISCITNIISIKTRRQVENSDYVTKMLFTIKGIFTGAIHKLLKGLEVEKEEQKKQ